MEKLDSTSSLRVGIFGSSLNPPGNNHLFIVSKLINFLDKIIVIPCGIRIDKPSTATTLPNDRKEMIKLAFSEIPNLEIDFHDLDNNTFTPTWILDKKYKKLFPNWEIWNVVGGDIIEGGKNGKSEIQKTWQKGEEIWNNLNWGVIDHPCSPIDHENLPPHNLIIQMEKFTGRSTDIRNNIAAGLPITDLVPKKVEEYIIKNNLYTTR